MQHTTQDHRNFDAINPALKRYALRLTHDEARAEDLVQDTYMSMLTRSKPEAEIKKPGPYMMSIMHNLFIDDVRRAKPHKSAVPLDDVEPVATEASQTLRLSCQETMEAIDHLSDDLREVLLRHACQGQSYAEISKALDIPMGTVMSRIARARAALCQAMGLDSVMALLEDQ